LVDSRPCNLRKVLNSADSDQRQPLWTFLITV
jgi:hypothetical protein